MIVIVHQAVGVADPIVALVHMLEGVEKLQPVVFGPEDGLPLIAAGGDTVHPV